jgi:hypothetical protein
MLKSLARQKTSAAPVNAKVVCPLCERLTDIELFSVESGRLYLHCPRCEQRFPTGARLKLRAVRTELEEAAAAATGGAASTAGGASTEPAPPSAPTAVPTFRPIEAPPGHCPKCIAPWPDDVKCCVRCGLNANRRQPRRYHPKAGLARRWDALLHRWDDPAEHSRFLAAAVETHELAGAGRLYAVYLAHRPGDAQAVRARDELLGMASTHLTLARQSKPQRRRSRAIDFCVVFSVALAALTLIARLIAHRG